MGAVLAAALGQIGLPGGGYAYALGAIAYYGRRYNAVPTPTLSQGRNGVSDFIPVARIADMLLNPGGTYRYNGTTRTYADIRLVYWAGGNPFHHHQDTNKLRRAWAKPDTIVVHEPWWTATARHGDIVLPATTSLERNDIGGARRDKFIMAMAQAVAPVGQARNDFGGALCILFFVFLLHRAGCLGEDRICVGTDQTHCPDYQHENYRQHYGILGDVLTLLVGPERRPERGQGERHIGTIL